MNYATGTAGAVAGTATAIAIVREPTQPYGEADLETLTPDELDDLADEIAIRSAHVHAAMGDICRRVARYDRSGAWRLAGHESCANWLSLHAGWDLYTAREIVRVGRALEELPESSAAMGRGALSLDQARVLTRVVRPETESDLLQLAENSAPSTFKRHCRAFKRESREDEAARERRLHDSRRLHLFPKDGMYKLVALLSPEHGAAARIWLDEGYFELHGKDRRATGGGSLNETPQEKARRYADAFGLQVERALAGLGGRSGTSDDPASDRTVSGVRAGRMVMLHVDADTLSADRESGLSELPDGTRIAAETARRFACDASVIQVTRDPEDGSVLNVGRSRRSTPPAIRRALQVRDGHCRFPGCNNRFTDSHHVHHWIDGGETSLKNTMLLCYVHHRLMHEGGWRVEWWGREKRTVFIDPRGQCHSSFRRKPPPLPENPADALIARNRADGVDPDALTAGARWQRERDIPDEVLFGALEALAPEPTILEPAAPTVRERDRRYELGVVRRIVARY